MAQNNNLQNYARISGVLVSKSVTNGTNKSGEYKSIDLVVRANEDEHQIRLYSNKFKADGTENKIYKSLETIENEYKTIEKDGLENAEKINITGNLSTNRYVGQDGQLKEFRQIRTNFANRHDKGEFEAKSDFAIKGVVDTISPKYTEEGDIELLEINLIVPIFDGNGYKEEIDKIKFVVRESAFFDYIDENFTKGTVVQLGGTLINRPDKNVPVQQVGFGKMPISRTRKINEYLCTGGQVLNGLEEISPYTDEEVNKALEKFNQKLVELQSKKTSNDVASNNLSNTINNSQGQGFGDINLDDIPF